MYDDYNTMTIHQEDRVLRIIFNRPDHLNAVNMEMYHEMACVFREVRIDPGADVITLTGAGIGFCVGTDFDEDLVPNQTAQDRVAKEAREILGNILEVDKPIITGVNGPATGLGAILALMGDIVIASKNARIGDTSVNSGISAGDGCGLVFPLLVGVNKAKELLLTGDIVDAQEALRIGLFNRVVPHDQLDQAVMETALKLASGHQRAIRYTKRAVNRYLKRMMNPGDDTDPGLEKTRAGRLKHSISMTSAV